MIKGIFKRRKDLLKGRELVTIELAEAREIADIILRKIEKKIEVLKAIESSVDEKILTLQRLIDKIEILKTDAPPNDREREVIKLHSRGLKNDEISEILDIPAGEVDLILNLQCINGIPNRQNLC
ncbi:MAG: DUF6115 domain-containing protein [Thermodesulfovibrionales bacterium]